METKKISASLNLETRKKVKKRFVLLFVAGKHHAGGAN